MTAHTELEKICKNIDRKARRLRRLRKVRGEPLSLGMTERIMEGYKSGKNMGD